jgi:ELWxxDGT repeat protein
VGTILLRDIRPDNSSVDQITPHGAGILFTAVDQFGSKGLWTSDGTTAGTVPVKDFYPGEEVIDVIGTIENEILMLVKDDGLAAEIWKSDGTTAGTIKLLDLNSYGTFNNGSVLVDGVLYFDIGWSPMLWRSDGTSCGTFSVDYIHPVSIGAFSSVAGKVIFNGVVNEALYFSNYGAELYVYEPEAAAPCLDVAARSAVEEITTSEDISMSASAYPNPFRYQFLVNIPGAENTTYSVQVVNLNGRVIETNQQLYHNREYRFGSQWGSGVYIMKAVVDGKLVTSKLVKVN